MKRIISLLCCLMVIAALLPTAAFASGQASIDVYAKYRFRTGLPEFPVDDNGESVGILPDGTIIQVTNAPKDAVTLVVRKIAQSETEPYVWFRQVLNGKGSMFQAYEIYFLDQSYRRLPAAGAHIRLSLPKSMEEPSLYSVSPNGAYSKCGRISGELCLFTADSSPYYVFAGYGFEDYRDKILEEIDDKHEKNEDDVRKDRIDEAYKEVEDYPYDPDKSYEENKKELDKILEELEKDLDDLKEFEEYRDKVLDKTDDLHKPGETDSRKDLIDKAYQEIEDYEYDFDKTLQENKDAIYKILDDLCKKLGISTPKTGDTSNLLLWTCTAGISLLLFLLLWKRRGKESESR